MRTVDDQWPHIRDIFLQNLHQFSKIISQFQRWVNVCSVNSFKSVKPSQQISHRTSPCTFNWWFLHRSFLLKIRSSGHWAQTYSSWRCMDFTCRRRVFLDANLLSQTQHTKPRWPFSYWWMSNEKDESYSLSHPTFQQLYLPPWFKMSIPLPLSPSVWNICK